MGVLKQKKKMKAAILVLALCVVAAVNAASLEEEWERAVDEMEQRSMSHLEERELLSERELEEKRFWHELWGSIKDYGKHMFSGLVNHLHQHLSGGGDEGEEGHQEGEEGHQGGEEKREEEEGGEEHKEEGGKKHKKHHKKQHKKHNKKHHKKHHGKKHHKAEEGDE